MKNALIATIFSLYSLSLFSQQTRDSVTACPLRISLLTCTPGFELYSTFGHSAIRVTDLTTGTDIIYNYGTFDFDDPSFYSKFVRGKLLYFVSVDRFQNFVEEYEYEQRGITEQELTLSCDEKDRLWLALRENAKEENKYYKYDFVYDNCTTRLRDMVFRQSDSLHTKEIRAIPGVTFRNLIHEYLDKSSQPWSELGIDILLGSPLDKKISVSETMFLPDYLLKGFDSTTIAGQRLVAHKKVILQSTNAVVQRTLITPLITFTALLILIALLTFGKKTSGFLYYFDVLLFFLSGALGLLLLFMWFGTDHQTCRNNYNLLWAFPGNILVAFFLNRAGRWVAVYFLAYSILLTLLLITWKWLPQEMNNGLIPLVALLLLRSIIRYSKAKK